MKRIAALSAIVLSIPLLFALILKGLNLMQGLVFKLASLFLWCLSAAAVFLMIMQLLGQENSCSNGYTANL